MCFVVNGASQVVLVVKNLPADAGDVRDLLKEGAATHFGVLACRILWTEEPGRLQFIELQSRIQLKPLSTHACLPSFNVFLKRSCTDLEFLRAKWSCSQGGSVGLNMF